MGQQSKDKSKTSDLAAPPTSIPPVPPTPRQQALAEVKSFLNAYQAGMLSKLLSQYGADPEYFAAVVYNAIQQSDAMLDVFRLNPRSLFGAVFFCAEMGLNPSPDLGEFSFIPFKGKKPKIKGVIGYKGWINIAYRREGSEPPMIKEIYAHTVHGAEIFNYKYGMDKDLTHYPDINIPHTVDNFRCVYACAQLVTGGKDFIVLSKDQVLDIARKDPDQDATLYFDKAGDPEFWMPRKVALTQLLKTLPKNTLAKRALAYNDRIMGGGYADFKEEEGKVEIIEGESSLRKGKSINSILQSDYLPEEKTGVSSPPEG